jgi:hypothetical protein
MSLIILVMKIPEKYIRHIWKNLYLQLPSLQTSDGQALTVLSVGTLNFNEGADFLNAKLRIGDDEKIGSVEIHPRTSDWQLHHHDQNAHYDKVILHVVFEHDDRFPLPVLELSKHLNAPLHKVIAQCIRDESELMDQKSLPCSPMAQDLDDNLKIDWLSELSQSRFINKAEHFAERLNGDNYDDLIYEGLMRALGYSENTAPMEKLAAQIPFQHLKSLSPLSFSERRKILESIYLSLAGFIPMTDGWDEETKIYLEATRERFQQSGFSTSEKLLDNEWVFFRLRPSNFPTVRLAGLSEILSRNLERGFLKSATDTVAMNGSIKRKLTLFESLFMADATGYWQTHYRFGEKSKTEVKNLVGKNRASEIVINTLLPVMYLFAKQTQNESLKTFTLTAYQNYPKSLSSETAKKTLHELLGEAYEIKSAAFEQGLLELKKNYCDAFRCLECSIGKALFSSSSRKRSI